MKVSDQAARLFRLFGYAVFATFVIDVALGAPLTWSCLWRLDVLVAAWSLVTAKLVRAALARVENRLIHKTSCPAATSPAAGQATTK